MISEIFPMHYMRAQRIKRNLPKVILKNRKGNIHEHPNPTKKPVDKLHNKPSRGCRKLYLTYGLVAFPIYHHPYPLVAFTMAFRVSPNIHVLRDNKPVPVYSCSINLRITRRTVRFYSNNRFSMHDFYPKSFTVFINSYIRQSNQTKKIPAN
ncbi:hypothetical protein KAR91_30960 [Candidatus Pacearchaeota archaeon]|nr:hypothetical protein [Candidatus Pacearchaeota archaeon]